ncbi:ROK family protein [Thermogemmatispora carboxidivorans]|uniref:ROK family protein n=1 Tax=Thermogemmatispora carboxidivorans TaxID=1382306 RepID=UPI0012DEE535|nr:ROK family protein [Thermogemmatispora carboxidivorans]
MTPQVFCATIFLTNLRKVVAELAAQGQPRKAADRFLIRGINQSIVLNLIRSHAPISRPRLAALSGLSQVTVIKIVNSLLERQLILEREGMESTGGRRAGLLELHPEGGFAIGLIPQPDSLTAAIVNLTGDLVETRQWPLTLAGQQQRAVELIADSVEELLSSSELPRARVIGLGLGLSGLIDAERGWCLQSHILGWKELPIREPLEERLGLPVFVDNDVNCLAIYEKLFGLARTCDHALIVAIGRGVGLGLILNGDLYRGAFGGAGEFGHTAVALDGRRCNCGNRGCLETYVSESGIVQNYLEAVQAASAVPLQLDPLWQPPTPTLGEVIARARAGEEAARAAIGRAGLLLGVALANLVNLLNPECIILSSPDTSLGVSDLLLDSLRTTYEQHVFAQMGRGLRFLTVKKPGYESWARGAGSLVLRHFFAPPAQLRAEQGLLES